MPHRDLADTRHIVLGGDGEMAMAHPVIWDDVVHTCSNQRIFCNETCVGDWLAASGNERRPMFDLTTLWHPAQGWYAGRLDSPYRRREPVEAHEYFRQVGLRGAFWGLD